MDIIHIHEKGPTIFASELLALLWIIHRDLKIPVPRRSNRRPDGAQPCKQHSDRALSLMLLGDFE
ncbi:hypothetical protein IJ11_0002015, partial [Lacticaseibacillus paracasei]